MAAGFRELAAWSADGLYFQKAKSDRLLGTGRIYSPRWSGTACRSGRNARQPYTAFFGCGRYSENASYMAMTLSSGVSGI
ncbi:MAG: hypothetical protein ACOYOU_16805, partial [Kiritimatiellia bacterium]